MGRHRFLLRAGKALSRRRKLAIVHFRSAADELRIGLDGPDDLTLQLTGGAPSSPVPLRLSAAPPHDEIPAYGRVLLDVLNGGSTLSVRGDEAEQAWRVLTPVLEAWRDGPRAAGGVLRRLRGATLRTRVTAARQASTR